MSRYWIFSQLAETLVDAFLNLADEIVTRINLHPGLAHSGPVAVDPAHAPRAAAGGWAVPALNRTADAA